ALPVPYQEEIFLLKQPGVLERLQPADLLRRPFRLRNIFQFGDPLINLLPGNQVFAFQSLQFASTQPGSPAEFTEFIVIGYGKMPVPDTVSPAPLNIRPVSFRRDKIVLVIRLDSEKFPHSFGFYLDRPSR